MANNVVKFYQTTLEKYNGISATVDSNALYFLTDTKQIYKGADLYAANFTDDISVITGNLLSGFSKSNTVSSVIDALSSAIDEIVSSEINVSGINGVNITNGEGTLKIFSAQVHSDDGVLDVDENGLFTDITLSTTTTTNGYLKSYALFGKDGQKLGESIDIPKDQFLKSAQFIPSAETSLSGVNPGDPYIEFTFETKQKDDATGIEESIDQVVYVNLKDIFNTYTAGYGIIQVGASFNLSGDATTDTSRYLTIGADTIGLKNISTDINTASSTIITNYIGFANTNTPASTVVQEISALNNRFTTEGLSALTKDIVVDLILKEGDGITIDNDLADSGTHIGVKLNTNAETSRYLTFDMDQDTVKSLTVQNISGDIAAASGTITGYIGSGYLSGNAISNKFSSIDGKLTGINSTVSSYVNNKIIEELDDAINVGSGLMIVNTGNEEAPKAISINISQESEDYLQFDGQSVPAALKLTGINTAISKAKTDGKNEILTGALAGYNTQNAVSSAFDSLSSAIDDIISSEINVSGINGVNITNGEGTLKIFSAQVHSDDDVLGVDENGLFTNISMVKLGTPSAGYAATYKLVGKDGEQLGASINIPKDQFLKGAEYIPSASQAQANEANADVGAGDNIIDEGDSCIRFIFEIKTKDEEGRETLEDHVVYVNTQGLVDRYIAGSGIAERTTPSGVEFYLNKNNSDSNKYLVINDNSIGLSGIDAAILAAVHKERPTDGDGIYFTINEADDDQITEVSVILASGEKYLTFKEAEGMPNHLGLAITGIVEEITGKTQPLANEIDFISGVLSGFDTNNAVVTEIGSIKTAMISGDYDDTNAPTQAVALINPSDKSVEYSRVTIGSNTFDIENNILQDDDTLTGVLATEQGVKKYVNDAITGALEWQTLP